MTANDPKQEQAQNDDAQQKANQAAQERADKAKGDEKPYEVTYPIADPVPDLGEQGENDDEERARAGQTKDADKK